MSDPTLSAGEIAVLIDGLSDEVALIWILIRLGLRGNPPTEPGPPSPAVLDATFASLERLVSGGYARVGRMEPVPETHPDPHFFGVVRHHLVDEPLVEVRRRVETRCVVPADPAGWEFSCWLVSTDKGDAAARAALAARRPDD